VDGESGQVVGGAFGGGSIDPSTPEGMRLAALPMKPGSPAQEIRDSVVPDGALDRLNLNLWFVNFRLGAYYNILKALGTDTQRAGVLRWGQVSTCPMRPGPVCRGSVT